MNSKETAEDTLDKMKKSNEARDKKAKATTNVDDTLKKMKKSNEAKDKKDKAKAKGAAKEETKQSSDDIDKKNRLAKENQE